MIVKVCERCGSDEVLVDAWAEWSVENQSYQLSELLDHAECEACGGETDIIDKVFPD